MTNETLVSKNCNKNEFIKHEIDSDAPFSVNKFLTSKKYTGTPKLKNLLIKCFLQIRNHTMNDNDGSIYLGLARCKSFDELFVSRCYHYFKFNHFVEECEMSNCQSLVAGVLNVTKLRIVAQVLRKMCKLCAESREKFWVLYLFTRMSSIAKG